MIPLLSLAADSLKQHLPEHVRPLARKAYHLPEQTLHHLTEWTPELVPFDQLFEGIEKRHYAPSRAVPTPEAPALPVEEEEHLEHLQSGTYTIPEDFTAVLHDVLYCPYNNIVMTKDWQALAESMLPWKVLEPYPRFRRREVRPLPGYCAILHPYRQAYYHALVDHLPRVMALNKPPYPELEEIQLICNKPMQIERFLLSKLAPENTRLVHVDPHVLYHVEHLIFTPLKTRQYAGYLPQEYVEAFREKVLPKRPSRRNRRILISRENSHKRRIENRDELMSALAERGFIKVLPEELSPQEEVEMFYDAEVVVGAHGSGLTNILFSKNIKVVELFPTRFAVPHWYFMCKSLGHDYAYLCGTGQDRHPTSDPVDIPAVLDLLDRMGVR